MSDDEFVPTNDFETTLVAVQTGHTPLASLLQAFMENDIAIPSAQEVMPDGTGMDPVFYDKEGIQMLAAYTSLDRAKCVSDVARYCLVMKGRQFLERMPPEYGLVINPGFKVGFDVSPTGIQEILGNF
jgi:hypothetical protein